MTATRRPAPRAKAVLTATCAAVGSVLAWWHWRGPWLAALAIATGSLLMTAIFLPRLYAPVFAVLDGVVRAILQVITWLLLGLVFALLFVPGRVLLALRRRDPLARRAEPGRTSYWHEVKPTTDAARHFRAQF